MLFCLIFRHNLVNNSDCFGRNFFFRIAEQGFDSPHLHQKTSLNLATEKGAAFVLLRSSEYFLVEYLNGDVSGGGA